MLFIRRQNWKVLILISHNLCLLVLRSGLYKINPILYTSWFTWCLRFQFRSSNLSIDYILSLVYLTSGTDVFRVSVKYSHFLSYWQMLGMGYPKKAIFFYKFLTLAYFSSLWVVIVYQYQKVRIGSDKISHNHKF